MRVLIKGHIYEINSLDGSHRQTLTFVQRTGEHYPRNTITHPGTTMQEVIRALLERSRYVYEQIPCLETAGVTNCLQTALLLLEIRAKRVKGKHLQESTFPEFEEAPVCPICGHVSCQEHKEDADAAATSASHTSKPHTPAP